LEAIGIARALKGVSGVIMAEDLQGPYDAIALTGADSRGRSLDGVVADIRSIPGVIRALAVPLRNATLSRRNEAA
jgi:hypothetical protein